MARPAQFFGCIEDGCGGDHYCRGRCQPHYTKWYSAERKQVKAQLAKTKVTAPRPKVETIEICIVLDCDLPRKTHEWSLHKYPMCPLHTLTRNHLPKWIVMTDYKPAGQSPGFL